MRRFLALALIFLLTALSSGAESIRAPRGFSGSLYKSVLALYGTKDGHTQFLCTAEPFEKISGGYHLLSAGHCVQLMPEGVAFFVSEQIGGPLTPVKMMKAYLGDGLDFSEFELKTDRKYSVFVLGDEHGARVGDAVLNPNFSAGVGKQLSHGLISSDILAVSPRCEADCSGDFIIQTFDAPGASGSAVVSVRTHQVIGIVINQFGDAIGFGVEPISKFYKFLAGPNQPHPADDSI